MTLEKLPKTDLSLPSGWFSKDDIEVYQKLVQGIPHKSILIEIGVWQGRSLCSIAEQIINKQLKVYAVDTFEGTPGISVVHNCNGQMKKIFLDNARRFGFTSRLTTLTGNSTSVAKNFQEKAGLVFIDGNHSSESVAADIKSWWPHIKKGGFISGHDFSVVAETVEKELGRVNHQGEIWWLQKNKSTK